MRPLPTQNARWSAPSGGPFMRVFDGIRGVGTKPVLIRFAREVFTSYPAWIRVRGLHSRQLSVLLDDLQRLTAQGLAHLLGVGGRLGAKRRELACERMFA